MVAAQDGKIALGQEVTSLEQEVFVLEQVGAPSRLWQCLLSNECRDACWPSCSTLGS